MVKVAYYLMAAAAGWCMCHSSSCHPISAPVAALAVIFGADYGLRAAGALHLATAVHAGAERFVTHNRRDFPRTITEVEVTYPDELPT